MGAVAESYNNCAKSLFFSNSARLHKMLRSWITEIFIMSWDAHQSFVIFETQEILLDMKVIKSEMQSATTILVV